MLAWNDSRNWGIKDLDPGRPLEQISPMSRRAHALLARHSEHPLLRAEFIRVFGTVAMLQGMEYHHGQSLKCIDQLALGGHSELGHAAILSALDHEAVAYIGRAGQFLAFVNSKPIDTPPDLIPKLLELKHFRDKFVAHRSMDQPRGEDPNLQVVHAMSVTTMGGYVLMPKDGWTMADPFSAERWRTQYLCYQARKSSEIVFFFSIERDHPTVMHEALAALSRLFA